MKAADKGITSLTKLVESAKSIAKQARQAPGPSAVTYGAVSVTVHDRAETHRHLHRRRPTRRQLPPATISLDVNVGGTTATVTTAAFAGDGNRRPRPRSLIQTAIDGNGATAGQVTVDTNGGGCIRITAANADVDVQVNANAASFAAGLTTSAADRPRPTTRPACSTTSARLGGTVCRPSRSTAAPTRSITFGTGVGQVSTLAELNTALDHAHRRDRVGLELGGALSIAVASSATQNSLTLTGLRPA